jgi:hypothetical protein
LPSLAGGEALISIGSVFGVHVTPLEAAQQGAAA